MLKIILTVALLVPLAGCFNPEPRGIVRCFEPDAGSHGRCEEGLEEWYWAHIVDWQLYPAEDNTTRWSVTIHALRDVYLSTASLGVFFDGESVHNGGDSHLCQHGGGVIKAGETVTLHRHGFLPWPQETDMGLVSIALRFGTLCGGDDGVFISLFNPCADIIDGRLEKLADSSNPYCTTEATDAGGEYIRVYSGPEASYLYPTPLRTDWWQRHCPDCLQ